MRISNGTLVSMSILYFLLGCANEVDHRSSSSPSSLSDSAKSSQDNAPSGHLELVTPTGILNLKLSSVGGSNINRLICPDGTPSNGTCYINFPRLLPTNIPEIKIETREASGAAYPSCFIKFVEASPDALGNFPPILDTAFATTKLFRVGVGIPDGRKNGINQPRISGQTIGSINQWLSNPISITKNESFNGEVYDPNYDTTYTCRAAALLKTTPAAPPAPPAGYIQVRISPIAGTSLQRIACPDSTWDQNGVCTIKYPRNTASELVNATIYSGFTATNLYNECTINLIDAIMPPTNVLGPYILGAMRYRASLSVAGAPVSGGTNSPRLSTNFQTPNVVQKWTTDPLTMTNTANINAEFLNSVTKKIYTCRTSATKVTPIELSALLAPTSVGD